MRVLLPLVLFAGYALAQPVAYLVRFGMDDKAAVDWSGEISPAPARITGWQFDPRDKLAAPGWSATTRSETYWDTPYERSMKGTSRVTKTTRKGIIAVYAQPPSGVDVKTAQGAFRFTGPGRYLDGRVEVALAPDAAVHAAGPDADDYPALLEASDTTWLAWQAYEKDGDRVYVRRTLAGGAWSEPEALTAPGGDLFRVALAKDANGHVLAIWSAAERGNFDLWARRHDGSRWLAAERLTVHPAPDFYHAAATDAKGNVHVVWQSAREGNLDIWAKSWDGKRWSAERRVSESKASDWETAIATSASGAVTVLWDTYDKGNYDVVMRALSGGPITPVAATSAFEARAQARYDSSGRLWVAYEEGDSEWGKDYGQGIVEKGRGLLVRRHVRVGVLAGGQWMQPAGDLAAAVPEMYRQAFVAPKLALTPSGAPRLTFRYRVNTPVGGGGQESARTMWRQASTYHDGSAWTPMMEFPEGYGRIDAGAAVTDQHVAWTTDSRAWPLGAPAEQNLMVARLPAAPGSEPKLEAFRAFADNLPRSHANEAADLARIRAHRVTVGGRTYRIVRGDIHRHTDISWDGNRDGSLHDSYRYAIDAVGFEYLGVCDHQAGNMIPYNWWMIQKAVDLFSITGVFAPLYSYERSLPYPNGHRNVVFAERGRPVLAISRDENRGVEGAAKLYAYLRQFGGLTTSHTSATGAGTDWRDSDEQVEPVVEIYQGYRRNYETAGAPRAPAKGEEPSKFEPGYVWNAWAKGIKMGVQSSSDHVSTHISYAALYVDKIERRSILDAIRARRTYAATDNVIVDLRAGGRFMGKAFRSAKTPPVVAHVRATGPLDRVDLVRNNRIVFTHPGSGSEARFTYNDAEPADGTRYFYLRIVQKDVEQLAWSSPIWIE